MLDRSLNECITINGPNVDVAERHYKLQRNRE
jgi:hypothetical protein